MSMSGLTANSLKEYASRALSARDSSSFLKYLIMYLEVLRGDNALLKKVRSHISIQDAEAIGSENIYFHFMRLEDYYRLIISNETRAPDITGYYDDLFLFEYKKFSAEAYDISEAKSEITVPESELDAGEDSHRVIFDTEQTQHSLRLFHNWLLQKIDEQVHDTDTEDDFILKVVGDFTVTKDSNLYRQGKQIRLPPQSLRLVMALLLSDRNRLGRRDVTQALWQDEALNHTNTQISKRVSDVNRHLKDAGCRHDHIRRDGLATSSYRFIP